MIGCHASAGLSYLGARTGRAVATTAAVAVVVYMLPVMPLRANGPDLRLALQAPDPSSTSDSAASETNSESKVARPLPPVSAAQPEYDSASESSRDAASQPLPKARSTPQRPLVPKTTLAEALERSGDLTLRNMSLSGALYTISEQWGINIVSGAVAGEVNGVFKDAPLREILDSILLSNGYSYRQVGESLVVSPMSELGQVNPFFKSATIPVRFADVNEVMESAKLLSTPQGQIHAIPSAKTLLVVDFPKQVDMIQEFVTGIDDATLRSKDPTGRGTAQPLQVGYFRTQFISAESAQKALEAILSKDGRVGVVEAEDKLLIVDFQENLAMARMVLDRVDRPRPQVRIRSLIYDLSLRDVEELGINWNTAAHGRPDAEGNPQNLFDIDSVLRIPFEQGTTGGAFTFMSLNRHFDITAIILALQNAKDSRLLADPNVVVMDNETAILKSVSEIPYQQLTQTGTGPPIGTTAFKNAGITLEVTPKISAEGTIGMIVRPEFSTLTGFTPGDNQPIIDTRSADTRLQVQNGQTFVIGGLRQRSDVGDFKGIPYLKDMKWIGKAFRARQTDIRESELVVFVCPEIVGYEDIPSPRQQKVAETLNWRLNQIPEAEGCAWPSEPCAVSCNPETMEAAEEVPMSETESSPVDLRPSPEQTPQEIPPPLPLPPQDADQPQSSIGPPPQMPLPPLMEEAELDLDMASFSPDAQTIEPERVRKSPVPKTKKSLVMPASQVSEEDASKSPAPLRLDYDSRFRRSEGPYRSRRLEEQDDSDKSAEPEKKTVWDKILLR